MRKLIIMVFAVIATGSIDAQTSPTYGVLAGPRFLKAKFTEIKVDTKFSAVFQAGGFASWQLADAVSVRPELLLIARKGFALLEVPAWINYNITPEVSIGAGPYVALPLKRKQDEYMRRKEPVELGAGVNANYQIIPKLGAGIRYSSGFTDVSTAADGDASSPMKRRAVALVLSYSLN